MAICTCNPRVICDFSIAKGGGSKQAAKVVGKAVKHGGPSETAESSVAVAELVAARGATPPGEFTDPTFPSGPTKLHGMDLKWMSVRELGKQRSHAATLFEDITSDDIEQGMLGDCYLLAAISALAERPKRIERLMLPMDETRPGTVAVRLFESAKPKCLVLDDRVPTIERGGKPVPAYARCGPLADPTSKRGASRKAVAEGDASEVWAMMLEKAVAKLAAKGDPSVNGGDWYGHLEGGTPSQALHALTGAPGELVVHSSVDRVDDLWDLLRDAESSGSVIVAGTGGGGGVNALIMATCFGGCISDCLSMQSICCPCLSTRLCRRACSGCCKRRCASCHRLATYGVLFLRSLVSLLLWPFVQLVACLCCKSASASRGLFAGHAYSVQRTLELQGCAGVRLVQLRNPWGHTEWTGAWSDGSLAWSLRCGAREAAGGKAAVMEKKDDGVFWMSLQDYAAQFSMTSITYVRTPDEGDDAAETSPAAGAASASVARSAGAAGAATITAPWHVSTLDLSVTGDCALVKVSVDGDADCVAGGAGAVPAFLFATHDLRHVSGGGLLKDGVQWRLCLSEVGKDSSKTLGTSRRLSDLHSWVSTGMATTPEVKLVRGRDHMLMIQWQKPFPAGGSVTVAAYSAGPVSLSIEATEPPPHALVFAPREDIGFGNCAKCGRALPPMFNVVQGRRQHAECG